MDPSLYTEAGPTDSSLPPGWPMNAKGSDDQQSTPTLSKNGCVEYTVMRHLFGPRREGEFLATGPDYVCCTYKGKCLWSIDIFRFGIRKTYVYKLDFFVQVSICAGVRTEKAIDPVPAGKWEPVSYRYETQTVQHIEDYLYKETPCPETYWGVGIPEEVRYRADHAAAPPNTPRGPDIPGPPPKPPVPDGPGISPMPPDDEMKRRKAVARLRERGERQRRRFRGEEEEGHQGPEGHTKGSGEPFDGSDDPPGESGAGGGPPDPDRHERELDRNERERDRLERELEKELDRIEREWERLEREREREI